MKKIYESPCIKESNVVVESIVAASVNAGFDKDQSTDIGRAEGKRQDGDWDNIWGN